MATRYVNPTEELEAEMKSGASVAFGSTLQGMVSGKSRRRKEVPTFRYAPR